MAFATLWTINARDLIRDIIIQDINNDKKSEVIFSSWDGNIYAVQGATGTRIWTLKNNTYTGPAEKLMEVKLSSKENHIAATKHKYLLLINGSTGQIEFTENFGSWIKDAISCDFDCDGRSEIGLLTRKNELYVIDDDGDIIFRKSINNSKILHHIALSTLKECICPNLLAANTGIISIRHYLADFLTETSFKSPILSLGKGKILPDLSSGSIIGLKDSIEIIGGNDFRASFNKKNLLPHIITTGDIDGDLQEEIIVGDWHSDSILILKIDNNRIKKILEIELDGNPVNVSSADIDGDGKNEVLTFIDKPEENFLIIDPYRRSKIIFIGETYPASLGLRIGDVLGYGFGDIVYRSGREKLSLLIHVPRIQMPKILREKEEFEINIIAQSKDKLVSSREIQLNTKKIKSTRAKLDVGWVTFSKNTGKALSYGTSWLKLQRGKKVLIQRKVIIASDHKLDKSVNALYCLDEDIIHVDKQISEVLVSKEYEKVVSLIKINKAKNEHHISLCGENYLRPIIILKSNEKTLKRPITVIGKKSIVYELVHKKYYLPGNSLECIIKNLSPIDLQIVIEGDELINIPDDTIQLPSKSSEKIALKIIYKPESLVENIRSSLKLIYEGNKRHCIQIPLEFKIINREKLTALAREILSVKGDMKEVYQILSSKTKLSPEVISKILSGV